VIQALDVASIYDVPLAYHEEGLDREVLAAFGITDAPEPDMSAGRKIVRAPSTTPRARSRSPSSASTRASRTPTSR
jgi:CTP synthase (UTP-ammonia lyase)